MAFDAAATVQAPMQGAAASARSAARRDDAPDPFGALLAMLDGAQTDAAPPSSPRPSVNVSADETSQADSPVPTVPGKDASADEAQAVPEAASDPATLLAAMMAPAVVAPAPVAAAPAAETPAAPPFPTTLTEAVVPALDPESSAGGVDAAAAPETQTAPVTPAVQTSATETAEVAPPVQKLAPPQPAEPAQTATPALASAPAPAAVADAAAAPASAEAAPYRLAGNDKPADAMRAEASATESDIAAAPRAAQGEQGRQFEGGGADGRSSDADSSQQARNDNPAVPAAELATFAAAADAAPEAVAPAVGVAQAAPPAPVIAAQAAVTPVRGAPETVAHLAAQMIQRLDGQTTRFDLSLNPQSLGRVDVRIEIGAKGALRARMAFDDAATAQEMSGRHTELRAALQNAGFDVPEGALSFDVASGGGGAFADRQDADRAAAPVFHNFADTADQDPVAAVKNYFTAAGSSGVDIRV